MCVKRLCCGDRLGLTTNSRGLLPSHVDIQRGTQEAKKWEQLLKFIQEMLFFCCCFHCFPVKGLKVWHFSNLLLSLGWFAGLIGTFHLSGSYLCGSNTLCARATFLSGRYHSWMMKVKEVILKAKTRDVLPQSMFEAFSDSYKSGSVWSS